MRFNSNELVELCNSGKADFSGELRHKASRTADFKPRHCLLRANCLFVKKASEGRPTGVILLENYHVVLEQTLIGVHAFSLTAQTSGDQSVRHMFLAPSRLDAEQWVCALQRASMSNLRRRLVSLRHLILTRTGNDPLRASNLANLLVNLEENSVDLRDRKNEEKGKKESKKRTESKTQKVGLSQPSFQSHVPVENLIEF